MDCRTSGRFTLNPCSDGWTGAPLGDTYEFSWGGDQKAMNRLNSPNVEKPLFSVPDNVDADTSYNYRVTVSARNADPASFPYRVDVDKRPPPSIVCVSPVSVDEGAAPFTAELLAAVCSVERNVQLVVAHGRRRPAEEYDYPYADIHAAGQREWGHGLQV